MKTFAACIEPTIAALDASLALQERGVFVHLDLLPPSDTYANVAYAVQIWASAHASTVELNPEQRTSHVIHKGHRVAILSLPASPLLTTERALQVVGPRAFGYEFDFVSPHERQS